jgi:hypothetical protein
MTDRLTDERLQIVASEGWLGPTGPRTYGDMQALATELLELRKENERLRRDREYACRTGRTNDELRKENEALKSEAKCVSCGTKVNLMFGPDPYAADIHGDDTPIWACDSCRTESAADI